MKENLWINSFKTRVIIFSQWPLTFNWLIASISEKLFSTQSWRCWQDKWQDDWDTVFRKRKMFSWTVEWGSVIWRFCYLAIHFTTNLFWKTYCKVIFPYMVYGSYVKKKDLYSHSEPKCSLIPHLWLAAGVWLLSSGGQSSLARDKTHGKNKQTTTLRSFTLLSEKMLGWPERLQKELSHKMTQLLPVFLECHISPPSYSTCTTKVLRPA